MTFPLKDPYATDKTSNVESARVQTDISMSDKLYLQSIIPIRGVFQTTINILLHDIISELRARNITSYDPSNLDLYVSIVRRRTDPLAARQAVERDDAGRIEIVHKSDASVTGVPASPLKCVNGGPRQNRRKGKSSEGKLHAGQSNV